MMYAHFNYQEGKTTLEFGDHRTEKDYYFTTPNLEDT
jgi:hypothetical protein